MAYTKVLEVNRGGPHEGMLEVDAIKSQVICTYLPAPIAVEKNPKLWPNEETLVIAAQKYHNKRLPVTVDHSQEVVGHTTKFWLRENNQSLWAAMRLTDRGREVVASRPWCSPLFRLSLGKGDAHSTLEIIDLSLVEDGGLNMNVVSADHPNSTIKCAAFAAHALHGDAASMGVEETKGQEEEEDVYVMTLQFAAARWITQEEGGGGTSLGWEGG